MMREGIPPFPGVALSQLEEHSSTVALYVVYSLRDCRLQVNAEIFHRYTNTCSENRCMARSTALLKRKNEIYQKFIGKQSLKVYIHQRLLNYRPLGLSLRLAELERKQINLETFKYHSLQSCRYCIICTAQLIYFLKYLY